MSAILVTDLSRAQFALTALFHILWPALTIGLSFFLVTMEALWLKTSDIDYYHHARFWSKLFMLNFAVGVVTGLPMEFEFGTNWAEFSRFAGSFFGAILGFEGAMAFMLEAGFLGIMLLGWQRVPRAVHFLATLMVATGASLSALWIVMANSWMQTPTGGSVINGRFIVNDFWAAMLNPDMVWGVSHMWIAALEIGCFVIGGLSAWYILKNRYPEFFVKSLKVVLVLAVVITPLQIYLGDGSGRSVFDHQPAKGAAIEGHWHTNPAGQGAPWAIVAWPNAAKADNDWAITVPHVLSVLATHTWEGQVKGLLDTPPQDRPPALPLLFYAFRLMVAIGFYFFALMLTSWWHVYRKGWQAQGWQSASWLLKGWIIALPLGYVAMEMGWIIREVGRQPWIIYGVLRTSQGVSHLPASSVIFSIIGYTLLYTVLAVAFFIFAGRWLRKGPDLTATPPAATATPWQDRRT
ncbi:MAG: cytochrome ubiquinol oxidase subunit I [Sulfuriferula sp.]